MTLEQSIINRNKKVKIVLTDQAVNQLNKTKAGASSYTCSSGAGHTRHRTLVRTAYSTTCTDDEIIHVQTHDKIRRPSKTRYSEVKFSNCVNWHRRSYSYSS